MKTALFLSALALSAAIAVTMVPGASAECTTNSVSEAGVSASVTQCGTDVYCSYEISHVAIGRCWTE